MSSVVLSMLGALALIALWGLRYPLKMMPMLLFEFMWKVIWVVAFALDPWLNGQLDEAMQETLFACLMGVVLVVPWGYVFRHYVKATADRWRGKRYGA